LEKLTLKPFQVKVPSHYRLIYGPDWHEHEGGQSISQELLQRVMALVDYLLGHDMVTGNIRFNEGVRSRQRAHQMSTSWFLRQPHGTEPSKIPLENLRALPGGNDLDGNQWYDPHWDSLLQLSGLPPDSVKELRLIKERNLQDVWRLIQQRAYDINPQFALAAEGYSINDPHILPNVHPKVSNHVGGNAIDCTIPWKMGVEVVKYGTGGLEKPSPWGMYDSHPIAKFVIVDGGLHDVAANCLIEHFGLCRPVKDDPITHKGGETWHFQLADIRRPLSRTNYSR